MVSWIHDFFAYSCKNKRIPKFPVDAVRKFILKPVMKCFKNF